MNNSSLILIAAMGLGVMIWAIVSMLSKNQVDSPGLSYAMSPLQIPCRICGRGELIRKRKFALGWGGGCLGIMILFFAAFWLLVLSPILPLLFLLFPAIVVPLLIGGIIARQNKVLQCNVCGASVNAS
jgi:hypothetical protein